MSDFFWFSDAQWARIGSLLPTDTRGMARVDDRRVLSGIVHAQIVSVRSGRGRAIPGSSSRSNRGPIGGW